MHADISKTNLEKKPGKSILRIYCITLQTKKVAKQTTI